MSPNRRTYLTAAGSAATALLAGCLSAFETDDDDGDDETDPNDADGETGPTAAVEAFLEAAANEDADAIAEAAHSASFLHPAQHEDSEFEYRFETESDVESVDDLESFEAEVLNEDASVDDVLDLEGTSFMFDEAQLEEDIGGGAVALVRTEATYADPDLDGALVTEATVWVVATEADEWRVYWGVAREESVDDREAAFDDPVIDEDGDVVEEIDWEYDQDTGGGNGSDGADDGFEWDVEWAQVVLTDSPGIEADRVRIESTIEGSEFEFSGEGTNAWAGSWANVSLDPDGDQIVVTAIADGEETVVHRERFEP